MCVHKFVLLRSAKQGKNRKTRQPSFTSDELRKIDNTMGILQERYPGNVLVHNMGFYFACMLHSGLRAHTEAKSLDIDHFELGPQGDTVTFKTNCHVTYQEPCWRHWRRSPGQPHLLPRRLPAQLMLRQALQAAPGAPQAAAQAQDRQAVINVDVPGHELWHQRRRPRHLHPRLQEGGDGEQEGHAGHRIHRQVRIVPNRRVGRGL